MGEIIQVEAKKYRPQTAKSIKLVDIGTMRRVLDETKFMFASKSLLRKVEILVHVKKHFMGQMEDLAKKAIR